MLEDKLELEQEVEVVLAEVEREEEEDDEKNSVLADESIEEGEEGRFKGMGLELELVLDNVVSAEKGPVLEEVEKELKLVELEAEKVLGLGLEEGVAFVAEAIELGLATEMALVLGLGLEEDVAVVEEALELEEGAVGDEELVDFSYVSLAKTAWLFDAAGVAADPSSVADVADPSDEAFFEKRKGADVLVLETKAKTPFSLVRRLIGGDLNLGKLFLLTSWTLLDCAGSYSKTKAKKTIQPRGKINWRRSEPRKTVFADLLDTLRLCWFLFENKRW